MFSHLLSAIKYLHRNSIVHLNIRPELILFQGESSSIDIKFLDFITARNLDEIGKIDENFEKLLQKIPSHYKSPELIS